MTRVVLTFQNHAETPRTYWIEPWAHDFTLFPDETFELRISAAGEPLVEYVHGTADTQIYLNDEDWSVVQDGQKLPLGHNRQFAPSMQKKEYVVKEQLNLLIDWTTNGGRYLPHSSARSTPLSSNHRQR